MSQNDSKDEEREITPDEYFDESKLTSRERLAIMKRGTVTIKPTLNLEKFLDGIFKAQKRSLKKESLYASAYTLSVLYHGIHYNLWHEKYKVMVPFWTKFLTIDNFVYIIQTFLFRYYRFFRYFKYLKLAKIIEKPSVFHTYFLIRIAVTHWDKRLVYWIFYYRKEMDERKKKKKDINDPYSDEIYDEEDYDIAWKYILTVNYYNGVNRTFNFKIKPPFVDFLDLVLIEFFRRKVILGYYDANFFLCKSKFFNKFDNTVIKYSKFVIQFPFYEALLILSFLEYARIVRYNKYIKAHNYLFNFLRLRKSLLQFPFDEINNIFRRRSYATMYLLKARYALINGCFIFFSGMKFATPKVIDMKEYYLNFLYVSNAGVFDFYERMHGSRVNFVRHFFYDISNFWRLFTYILVARGPKKYYCENYSFRHYYSFWEYIIRALPDHYRVLSHIVNLLERRVLFNINRQHLIKYYFINDFKIYYEISSYYSKWKEMLVFYKIAHLVVCVAIHKFIINFIWGQRFYRGWLPWNRIPFFLRQEIRELEKRPYYKFNHITLGFSDLIFTFNYYLWRALEYKWDGSFFDNALIDCMLYDRYELFWSSFKWQVENYRLDPNFEEPVDYQELRPYSYTHLNTIVLTDVVYKLVKNDPRFGLLFFFYSLKGCSYVDLKLTDRDCLYKFVHDYGSWLRPQRLKIDKNFDVTESKDEKFNKEFQ